MIINKIKKSKYEIILFLAFFVFLFLNWFNLKDNFDIKISIQENNFDCEFLDRVYGKNLSEKILQTKKVKTVYSISSFNYCDIYIKFNFISDKTKEIQKIKSLLDDFISKTNLNPEIDFDIEFQNKYDYFLLIFNDKKINEDLTKYSKIIFDKLSKLNFINKIYDFKHFETLNYIYFKDSDLLTYNLNPSDIKNIIQENNINQNTTLLNNNRILNCTSDITNIEDLKKISFYYQDKNYSNTLGNIFHVEKSQIYNYPLIYKNREAILFGIKKKNFILNILFNFLIKNELNKNNLPLKYEVMEAKNLNKYFINISSKKEKTISYKYNQSDLNSYFITNKELTENILANSEGLICDYYYEDSKRIKIILKNIQNSDFIYSKKYKNLINLSSLLTKDIKEKYIFIIRKDGNII